MIVGCRFSSYLSGARRRHPRTSSFGIVKLQSSKRFAMQTNVSSRSQAALDKIKRLDEEYISLEKKEETLKRALVSLKNDEECLKQGIKEASSVSLHRKSDAEAVSRLEEALLLVDSDSDSTNESRSADLMEGAL